MMGGNWGGGWYGEKKEQAQHFVVDQMGGRRRRWGPGRGGQCITMQDWERASEDEVQGNVTKVIVMPKQNH